MGIGTFLVANVKPSTTSRGHWTKAAVPLQHKSKAGGTVSVAMSAYNLGAIQSKRDEVQCSTMKLVQTCSMVNYKVATGLTAATKRTFLDMDSTAKSQWMNWFDNADRSMLKEMNVENSRKCQAAAINYFCSQQFQRCEASPTGGYDVYKLCADTCTEFFQDCYKQDWADAFVDKTCVHLEKNAKKCSGPPSNLWKKDSWKKDKLTEKVKEMQEDAFKSAIGTDLQGATDPKALPGIKYFSFLPIMGRPLAYGVYNFVPKVIDVDVKMHKNATALTLELTGKLGLTMDFYFRLMDVNSIFGINDHGSLTINDPDFKLVVSATIGDPIDVATLEKLSAEMQQAKDKFADALNQANAGNFLNKAGEKAAKKGAPAGSKHWTASEVELAMDIGNWGISGRSRWFTRWLVHPITYMFKNTISKAIADYGAGFIASVFVGESSLAKFFKDRDIDLDTRIKMHDPTMPPAERSTWFPKSWTTASTHGEKTDTYMKSHTKTQTYAGKGSLLEILSERMEPLPGHTHNL
jgi:hypothetical protein